MTIYFSAALTQKRQFGKYYNQIVAHLQKKEHQVFQDTTTTSFLQAVNKNGQQRFEYYQQVKRWIKQSDAVFLEVSFPSTLHIGHEVSLGIQAGKPVVALFKKNHEPSFFLGFDHELLLWAEYDDFSLATSLDQGLRFAQDFLPIRYNLFLTRYQHHYLDFWAKQSQISKAAYVRSLIDKDMRSNKILQSVV